MNDLFSIASALPALDALYVPFPAAV